MSRIHKVVKGDRLYKLANKYYGNSSKWGLIRDANPQLSGRGKASDGSPLIYPNRDLLTIPEDTSDNTQQKKTPENIEAESIDEVSISIEGNKFTYWTEYDLIQEMDSFDSYSFSAPFDITQDIHKTSFLPFSYKEVQIYYGGSLFLNGLLLAPQSESNYDSRTITVTGYPKCGILNDCCMPITSYPLEFVDQKLDNIARNICQPFGITIDFQEDAGNNFKKVNIDPDKIVLDFLIELAGQRSLIISNNAQGNLMFWKAKQGATIANIKEGEMPYLSCRPNFNPQGMYSHITGLLKNSSTEDADKYTFENTLLSQSGITKPYNYTIQDAIKSDIENSVKSKAGRMIASTVSYQLTVQGHRNPNGGLWEKNTLITLEAPGAMVYSSTNFLIKKVTIRRTSDEGDLTVLDLVLPEAYSGDIPARMPYDR